MELKFKESIKLELIEKIKGEIVKRVTDDILNEKSSLEFKEEINDYFFEKKESVFKSEEFIKMKEFVEKMDGNKLEKLYDGRLKEYFDFMLKGEKTPNVNNDYDSEEVANQIARDPLQKGVMFTEGVKKQVSQPITIKNILNENNLDIVLKKLKEGSTSENNYNLIEFSQETIHELFKKLDENKESLSVTVEEKGEIGFVSKTNKNNGIDVAEEKKFLYFLYHVFSKDKQKFDNDLEILNKDYLAFDLKVNSMSNIELQNLYLNGIKIPQGIISIMDAKKIYEIVCEIINSKPKETEGVTETIKEELPNLEISTEDSLKDKKIISTDDVIKETLKKSKRRK